MKYAAEIECLEKSRTIADSAIREMFHSMQNMKTVADALGISTITVNRVLDGNSMVNIKVIVTILKKLSELDKEKDI